MAPSRRSRQQTARADAATLGRPRPEAAGRLGLLHVVPSLHSLVVGLALLALAAGAYALARGTSVFAVRRIEVEGAGPQLAAQVRRALQPLLQTSLIELDGAGLERRVEALPSVVDASYDRAFPHTLRVVVVPERPVAVLRTGSEAWLVSARGRLVARVAVAGDAALPRLWEPAALRPVAGDFLAPAAGGVAARSLAFAGRFPARIRTASFAGGTLVFRLGSGLELRLGDPADLRLKLAVARRALPRLPAGTTYLDVSLPGRLVTGDNPQVSGRG